MALSKSALKAKFITGAIPTQTDFASLIDGMLSMPCVTIIYIDSDYNTYVYNCLMGMVNIDFIVPICIHSLIKLRDVEDDSYSGAMSILQRTVYNYMTVKSEWEKIMKL